MSDIKELENVPEIDFIGETTLESLREDILAFYAKYYEEETGVTPELKESNPFRMIINAFALQLYQTIKLIDYAGKQNFLKYASGSTLDNLGAFKKITREDASPAKTTLQFNMQDVRSEPVGIPGGTRVCTETEVVFATDEYAEIPAGEKSVEVTASAEETGVVGNGYAAGTVSEIMDDIPYVESVTNTSETTGGKDIQSDDDFTLDIYNAPKGTSMGGPEDAYEAMAYKMRPDVYDVKPVSPQPCYVDIYFTLDGGVLPSSADLTEMEEYFSPKNMRPQGDRVSAKAPEEIGTTISLTYYISQADASAEEEIKGKVADAVKEYKVWQRRIGRDVNPSELIRLIMAAGAKRVALTTPAYTKINADVENGVQICKITSETVSYGGLEK